jgi:hypothetical protein
VETAVLVWSRCYSSVVPCMCWCICQLWAIVPVLCVTAYYAGLILSFIVCMCHYLVFISCSVSNIRLYASVFASFMCNPFLLVLCMWYFSSVFRCFPILFILITFVVLIILPCACPVFNIWFEYPEQPLLFLDCLYVLFITSLQHWAYVSYVF